MSKPFIGMASYTEAGRLLARMGQTYREDALPQAVREHLICRVVDELIPITQKHDIEGLVMGTE